MTIRHVLLTLALVLQLSCVAPDAAIDVGGQRDFARKLVAARDFAELARLSRKAGAVFQSQISAKSDAFWAKFNVSNLSAAPSLPTSLRHRLPLE